MKAIFKPGDRVTFKHDKKTVMTVQKYARQYSRLHGWTENPCYLECTWVKDGKYNKAVFHQSVLTKHYSRYAHQHKMESKFSNNTASSGLR